MVVATRPSAPSPGFAFPDDHLDALRARLAGQVIGADSAEYDEARRTLYVTVDRRPLAIVRAANARDVAETASYARFRGLPLAVRSGGHSLAHYSVVDAAVVVDLSGLNAVAIDPVARIASV